MIYKNVFSDSRIKYGFSKDFDKRKKNYITHTGDLIIKTIEFPQEKDRVDELAIKEFLTNILNLFPVGGSKEVFKDPGDLNIIDSDLTLETFYRYLDKLGFIPSESGKLSGYLKKRLLALHKLFSYDDNFIIDENIIKTMASLMESLYINNYINLEDNIFIKAKVDDDYVNYLLSLNLTCRDILDIWFKWDWKKLE